MGFMESLFDDFFGKVRRDHPETSVQAAIDVEARSGTMRRQVYDRIHASGEYGRTDEEIQTELKMNPSTQRPRRVELVQRRAIRDSGKRRRTRALKWAVVWIIRDPE